MALLGSNRASDSNDSSFLDMPEWVGYTFGTLFIILGILIMILYKKQKVKADDYRKRQLEEYNKQNRKNVTNYEATGMFLPVWEKIKLFSPILFGMVFVIIGVAWISGQTLSIL